MTATLSKPLPDLPSLTGLRFWAAYSILLNHLLMGFVARDNPYFPTMLGNCGILGMNIFFVLSGFIIHYNYHQRVATFEARALYDFFVARFSRLYPLYICLFLLDLLTTNVIQGFTHDDVFRSLPYFLTMTQTWVYQQTSNGASFAYMFPRASITWSVSTEMLLYFSYPALLWVFLRDKTTNRTRLITASIVAILFSAGMRWLNNNIDVVDRLAVEQFGSKVSMANNASYSFAVWLVFLSPYVRLFEFIIGGFAAHLFLSLRDTAIGPIERRLAPAIAMAAVGFIVLTFLPPRYAFSWVDATFKTIGYYPFIAVVVFSCARYDFALVTRFFAWRPFVVLGERSYSIYLFHIVVYHMATYGPSSDLTAVIRILVLWAAVFGCSHILYT